MTISIKYISKTQPVTVKTTGQVYAESAAFDAHLDELGL